MNKLTVGSLFAGIGGIELGLERTGGFETVWQVESDPYAQKVLAKHWPEVGRWDDVRTFPPPPAEDWACDIIVGGFPCQPFSTAARGRNTACDLWPEMFRVVASLSPRIVIAENVSKLAIANASEALELIGYGTAYRSLGADDFGADHSRRRWWMCAYSDDEGKLRGALNAKVAELSAVCDGIWGWSSFAKRCRVSDGVSARLDRLRCLGNAVVPQVAQWIGERILEAVGAKE